MHFGIMACRRSLPQVQRFIHYLEDALVELEDAVGISSQPPAKPRAKVNPTAAVKKSAPRAKAKAKAKARSRAD